MYVSYRVVSLRNCFLNTKAHNSETVQLLLIPFVLLVTPINRAGAEHHQLLCLQTFLLLSLGLLNSALHTPCTVTSVSTPVFADTLTTGGL